MAAEEDLVGVVVPGGSGSLVPIGRVQRVVEMARSGRRRAARSGAGGSDGERCGRAEQPDGVDLAPR